MIQMDCTNSHIFRHDTLSWANPHREMAGLHFYSWKHIYSGVGKCVGMNST